MKKIIAAAMSAVMIAGSAAVNAGASDRVNNIYDAIKGRDEIHIIYNDKVVEYEDVKPVNNEDRVMIPFRAALENMGATVDYDDENRLVTATKGDTTIHFTLMDDTIYINNNGAETTITMDVPMIIVEDRTLVPIRFMSNAFGMQVGWDGATQTVVIMDHDDYFKDFEEVAPNLAKLSSFSFDRNKSETAFEVSLNTNANGKAFEASTSGSASSVKNAGDIAAELTLSLNTPNVSFENKTMSAVFAGGTLYVNSDFVKSIASGYDNERVSSLVSLIPDNGWCSIDFEKILSGLGMSERTMKLINTALHIGAEESITNALMSGVSLEGDADFTDTLTLASQVDLYEELDKYINVNEVGGGYTMSIDISEEDFAEIVRNVLGQMMTEEDKNAISDKIKCSISANSTYDGEKETANADASIGLNANGTVFDLKVKLNKTAETAADATVTVPQSSIDMTDLILLLL